MSAGYLVTGASRGIGACVLAALDPRSQRYATCRPTTLQKGELDASARWIGVDFAQARAIKRLVQTLRGYGDFTGLAGLVLNAGVAQAESFGSGGEGGFGLENLQVNLAAPLQLIHALLQHGCIEQGAGIVMIGSNLARHGLAGKVSYSAAKAGLEGATRSLAHELGPWGIRVNTVAPGVIDTDMTQHFDAEARKSYCEHVPLGRIGRGQDVANVVNFFLSPASGYVTGQVLDVDGGWGA